MGVIASVLSTDQDGRLLSVKDLFHVLAGPVNGEMLYSATVEELKNDTWNEPYQQSKEFSVPKKVDTA